MENGAALIDIGKKPGEISALPLLFWLPADTPFGNMQLKLFKVVERLDMANVRLLSAQQSWTAGMSTGNATTDAEIVRKGQALRIHGYLAEEAITHTRRAIDELISLVWFLSEFERNKKYPHSILVDCIGGLLNAKHQSDAVVMMKAHESFLRNLNDISNALKHSFIQSDSNLIGATEPAVYALSLYRNEISAGAKLQAVGLRDFAMRASAFYRDAMSWLYAFSQRNLPAPTQASA
jgi:hypothetical protein